MNDPVWLTNTFELGTIAEGQYFEVQLQAMSFVTPGQIKYKLVAGKLPPGIILNEKTGKIHGVTDIIDPVQGREKYIFTFTIRAINKNKQIADRTFQIVINGLEPPVIVPPSFHLGQILEGNYFYFDLNVLNPTSVPKFKWRIINGKLPPGLKLNTSTGEIIGHIIPVDRSLEGEYTALNHRGSWDGIGFDMTPWSPSVRGWDLDEFITRYTFTIEVFDGSNIDRETYSLDVALRELYLASTTYITSDSTSVLASADSRYNPIIITDVTRLTARHNTDFIFKINAIDYNGSNVKFALYDPGVTSILPPGVELTEDGWVVGRIMPQLQDKIEYSFTVYAYKEEDPTMRSTNVTFKMLVLGEYNYYVNWISNEYLGSIMTGGISEFQIKAMTPSSVNLTYELVPTSRTKLPRGLKLLPDGLISGQVGFSHFTLDGGKTTIDKNKTTVDREFIFDVRAVDPDAYISSVKTFKIRLIPRTNSRSMTIDKGKTTFDRNTTLFDHNFVLSRPYENLYIKGLLSKEDRQLIKSIIDNEHIFPRELIYRINDYNFGLYKDAKFLFLPGLEPSKIADYAKMVQEHHFNKRISFSDIKTAIAVDENFKIKYEVVYIEIKDEAEGDGPAQTLGKTITSTNPYFHKEGESYRDIKPNSLSAMQQRVINEIGFSYKGALPDWMTSRQKDGRVLGLTNAIVLAYTVPGASELIAYRLKYYNITFNTVDFVADRYQLRNHLSGIWDIDNSRYITSEETTFDRVENSPANPYIGSVRLASELPFELINGKTLTQIRARGGIDGIRNIRNGDRLIFIKQERYDELTSTYSEFIRDSYDMSPFGSLYYDMGAVRVTIGDLEPNPPGDLGWYWSGGMYNPVPGYVANILNPLIPNMRMGIWQISIDEITEVVTLNYVSNVHPYESVLVTDGLSFKQTRFYFDPNIDTAHGWTVPTWKQLTVSLYDITNATIFDNNSTRFFDGQTESLYVGSDIYDKYIKFPEGNIFVQG